MMKMSTEWLLCVRKHIRVDKSPQMSFSHKTSIEGEVVFAELAPNLCVALV